MLKRVGYRLLDEIVIRRDPVAFAKRLGVRVWRDCRLLAITRGTFGSEPWLVSLGNHVTITGGVSFVTHDGGVWVFRERYPNIEVIDKIVVDDNVFIGLRSVVMPGVIIGKNCVIGAGSIVSRSIPGNSVAAGVPARVICSIDEYWEKVKRRATHVRGLSSQEKRSFLVKHLSLETE